MNESIFYFLYNLSHQSQVFDQLVVFFAQTFPFVVVILALVFLVKHRDALPDHNSFMELVQKWKEIFIIFLSGVFAWAIATIMKIIIQTERPAKVFQDVYPLFSENTYAFPSQHTVFFASIGISLFLVHKRVGALFIAFALMIGIARVIGGVHHPVDILGGFIIGGGISYILMRIFKKI